MDRKIPAKETRAIVFEREAVRVESRSVELAFSSEIPLVRWWGIEVLSHDPGAMRMGRMQSGGALLLDHNTTKQIGVVEECRCDNDQVGRAVVRFSKSEHGEEVFQDVLDGIRKNVSVGYQVHRAEEMDVKKMPKGLMELAAREQLPVYRVVDWEPMEISVVAVPADPSVGIGRAEDSATVIPVPPEVKITPRIEIMKEERKMDPKSIEEIEQDLQRERTKAGNEAREQERTRVQGINDLARQFKGRVPDFIRTKAVDEGTSLEAFQSMVLARIGDGTPIETPIADLGLSNQEMKRYSITRAIASQWKGSGVDAGFERACHDELVKRGIEPSKGGILVPYDLHRQQATARRDLSLASDAAGGYLKGTDHLGTEFIDVLRNRLLLKQLGCRILTGLKGSISIPKRTAGASSYWVADGSAPTEGDNTFGTLTLAPKHVAANVDYTRGLLLQSNPSIDALVNGDLAVSLATAIDLAGFEGAGTAEPTGISNTGSIGAFTGTSLDYAALLNAQSDVATANALTEACAYVTTPAVAALLAGRVETTYGAKIWTGNLLEGKVAGFRAAATNQLTAATMIFGDFSQLILAEWGTLELVVDPYSQSKLGIIAVTAFQSVDVGVRYAGAFSRSTSIT